jgi:hypothetical protein
MRTPSRVGWNEFQASVRSFYNDYCRQRNTSERPACKKCGNEIATIVAYMDVHDGRLRDSCAGLGRVWQLPIPYCPRYEEMPSDRGCIHVAQAFASSPVPPSFELVLQRRGENRLYCDPTVEAASLCLRLRLQSCVREILPQMDRLGLIPVPCPHNLAIQPNKSTFGPHQLRYLEVCFSESTVYRTELA